MCAHISLLEKKIEVLKFKIEIFVVKYYYLLLLLLLNAIEFSPVGSSPYTRTDKTNKNKIYIKETTKNTVQKYKTH
jgi:hypothetical protein